MKYIVMEVKPNKSFTLELPIVFPDILVHADVAEFIKCLMETQFKTPLVKPISAGFLNSIDSKAKCYGESESLKLKSRPEDSVLICMADYGGTIK